MAQFSAWRSVLDINVSNASARDQNSMKLERSSPVPWGNHIGVSLQNQGEGVVLSLVHVEFRVNLFT